MAQVAFWSPGGVQLGNTSLLSSVASYIALNHDYNNLMISSNYMDNSLESGFVNLKKMKARSGIDFTDVGLDALERLIKSNKITMENLADYTTPILKGRLDLMFGSQKETEETYNKVLDLMPGILKYSTTIYDYTFIDIVSGRPDEKMKKILEQSDVVVINVSQSFKKIEEFFDETMKSSFLKKKKVILVIGRYDKYSKFNTKNLKKYFKYKDEIYTLPYNTQYFDMQNEHKTLEFFVKYLNALPSDRNGFFVSEVKNLADEILASASSSVEG